MTPTWYNTPERIDALDTEALRWFGTPFMENSAVIGTGVSCHFLDAELYFATGKLARFDVPRGSVRKLINGVPDAFLSYLDKELAGQFVDVDPTSDILPGDLVVMAEGRFVKHVGVVLSGGRFVHVLRRKGVFISLIADSTYTAVAVRRPLP